MEHKYGASHAQKFCGTSWTCISWAERGKEERDALMLVENQPYIHYNKGSLAFYALRDYIGEDSLNAALRRFVRDKAFQKPPYTTSIEMLQYIRAVTPDSLQYVIHDLFETITLYDNKADTATATKRPMAAMLSTSPFGQETAGGQPRQPDQIPVADYIDVGVFGARNRATPSGNR